VRREAGEQLFHQLLAADLRADSKVDFKECSTSSISTAD
jgi:hypothetical protein